MKRCALVVALALLAHGEGLPEGEHQRNPFAKPEAPVQEKQSGGQLLFGFSASSVSDVEWGYMPRIVVTGLMAMNGSQIACARVEGIGSLVLKAGDRIMVPPEAGGGSGKAAWFFVESIENNQMTIQLDNGDVVVGQLF